MYIFREIENQTDFHCDNIYVQSNLYTYIYLYTLYDQMYCFKWKIKMKMIK